MKIDPDKINVTVNLLGAFNPAIFTPQWFFYSDLINKAELDSCQIEVVHPEVSIFNMEWFRLGVQLNKFSITTEMSPYIRVADLVIRTFKEVLPHTPVYAAGINMHIEFDVGTEAKRNEIGNKLAPPTAWGDWGNEITSTHPDKNTHGGMAILEMQQLYIPDRPNGYFKTAVRPTPNSPSSITVSTNDHYEVEQEAGSSKVMIFIEQEFEKSLEKSKSIADQIMKLKDA